MHLFIRISQFFVTAVIQGDLDKMILLHTLIQQTILEQAEQQV